MIRRASGLLLSGVAMIMVGACASSEKPAPGNAATVDQELIGGEAGSPFNTGAIQIQYGCTATMIGANQILTAAHCVVKMNPPLHGTDYGSTERPFTTQIESEYAAGQSIAFTNSAVIDDNTNWFTTTILGVDLSPTYMNTCGPSNCLVDFAVEPPFPPDLAIITVDDVFPDAFGYAATLGSAGVGDVVTETGYGCTDSYNGPPSADPSTFKFAPATLLDPTNAQALTAPGFGVPRANVSAFSQNYYVTAGAHGGGDASLCPGDSGGPLFRGPLAQYYSEVVGVNSYYFFPPDDAGISSYNIFARLDTQDAQNLYQTSLIEYPAPSGRGKPINDGVDPISSAFPLSTVGLETPGTSGCTGVILTPNSILTAAHCNVGPTTIVHFYVSDLIGGSLPAFDITASSNPVQTQGVTCRTTDPTFPDSCFIPSKVGAFRHNADLAVLTLSQTIPIGFFPVVLGTRGYGGQGFAGTTLPVWWEVTTGGPAVINNHSREEWAPVTYDASSSDGVQAQGYFFVDSLYGMWGDSGGPVFQSPSLDDDAGVDGGDDDGGVFRDMTLLGLVSDISPCLASDTCEHKNMVVSVTQPDNYDWLVGLGGSPVPATATFGAGP